MKKIITLTSLFLALATGSASAGIENVTISGGNIDRAFDTDRTLYYVEQTSTAIPQITADGATAVKTATNSDDIRESVTVLKDDETGKEYRFVIKGKNKKVKINSFTISKIGELTVKYSAPDSEYINLVILKPASEGSESSFEISDLDGTADLEKVLAVERLDGGEGTFTFNLPEDSSMGMYTAVLGGDGIYEKAISATYYISESGLGNLLSELNGINGENEAEKLSKLDSFIEKYALVLNLSKDEYFSVKDRALFVKFMTGNNFADFEDALEGYNTALVLSKINEAENVIDVIRENKELLGADLEVFDELEDKALVSELIKKETFKESEEVLNAFNRAVAVSYINESEPSQIEERFQKIYGVLSEEEKLIKNYEKCRDKEKVLKLILNQDFKNFDALVSGIVKAIKEVTVPPKPSNTGSGGGGGGSSSMPYIPAVKEEEKTPEPDSEKVIEEKPELYDDISDVEWAREAIMLLSDRKIVNGKGNNKFAPNDFVTREEFVKMLVTALELESNNSVVTFEDVEVDEWYYEYILVGVGNKVVTGKSDTLFGVGENITRQDMAVMVMRAMTAAKIEIANVINSLYYELEFEDTEEISDYAKDSVKALVKKGIVSGVGNNLYSPKSNATRAQAAQMIYRLIKDN